jgi:hypothetical protein
VQIKVNVFNGLSGWYTKTDGLEPHHACTVGGSEWGRMPHGAQDLGWFHIF